MQRNTTRGLRVAHDAHYEDFQRSPADATRALLRAVGIGLGPDGPPPPPSGHH